MKLDCDEIVNLAGFSTIELTEIAFLSDSCPVMKRTLYPLVSTAALIVGVGVVPCIGATPQSASVPLASTSVASATAQSDNSPDDNLTQLLLDREAVLANGGTQPQLTAWDRQNGAKLFAQELQTEIAGQAKILPTNVQVHIGKGSSTTQSALLTTQISLMNLRASIHNQFARQLAALGTTPSAAQLSALEVREQQQFSSAAAGLLKQRAQQLKALMVASSGQVQHPVPGPLVLAPNTSAPKAAYLTLANELRRSLVETENQYATADPVTRSAALAAWRQQNAAQMSQLIRMAQSMAQAEKTPAQ